LSASRQLRHPIKLEISMLTEAKRRTIAGVMLALVVFAGWQLLGWGGQESTHIAGAVGALIASSFAFACTVTAAYAARERQRAAWACLAVGLAGWAGADIYRACVVLAEPAPPLAPWLGEFDRLLFPVGAAFAAAIVPMVRGWSGLRLLLDGVIVATSLYVVGWVVVLRGLAEGASGPHFVWALASVVADAAMLTIGVMVLVKTRGSRRLSVGLLTLALVIIGLTDAAHLIGYVHAFDTGVLLVGWSTGMCLIGLAALTSKSMPALPKPLTRQTSRLSLWLPYAPVPLAVVLGAIELWSENKLNGYILFPGLVLVMTAFIRQITLLYDNRRLLERVAETALRDPLTGLANRTLFSDRLADAIHVWHVTGGPVSVLVLDIDDFKLVNDSLGHPAGDALLRSVGDRIQLNIRTHDTVARIGGDEFAILVRDRPEAAGLVAEQIVDAFDEPIVVDGRPLYMRISLGLATASASEDNDISADELLRRADLAMYSAKRATTGGVRAFTSTMHHSSAGLDTSNHQRAERRKGMAGRMQLLAELREAIDERRLELVYQPKVSLSTGAVVGAEALLRWPHPAFGVLQPDDFLPMIRENDLIDHVTNLVLSMAVSDAAGWYAAGMAIPVAVNLSAPSLNDESLPDRVVSVLAERELPAEALTIEITEDVLLASVIRARSVLDRLRDEGVRVAIDDFGSGFATMKYLRDLPIDELKLDRQFVTPILHDDRSAMIVRSIIELADAFGIASVAEGVENAETADRLREYGCEYVQGHYFSPPVPAAAIRLGIWGSPLGHSRISPSA
jgi:diguanylate cyclase (GGDEF)-like protein